MVSFRFVRSALCAGALLGVFVPLRPVAAQAVGLGLAQAKHCVACHRVDEKRVGPPFNAIAQRFKGEDAAIPYLAQRIREGSRGQWGAIGMPRQDDVSQEEAENLAAWILSLYGKE